MNAMGRGTQRWGAGEGEEDHVNEDGARVLSFAEEPVRYAFGAEAGASVMAGVVVGAMHAKAKQGVECPHQLHSYVTAHKTEMGLGPAAAVEKP